MYPREWRIAIPASLMLVDLDEKILAALQEVSVCIVQCLALADGTSDSLEANIQAQEQF